MPVNAETYTNILSLVFDWFMKSTPLLSSLQAEMGSVRRHFAVIAK
jgi:hypothetical protein